MFLSKKSSITTKALLIRIVILMGLSVFVETLFFTDLLKAQEKISPHPSSNQSYRLKEIKFIGNTVFSDSTLEKIVASYKGQAISLELLQRIGQEIDTYYINEGFLTSGSFIASQELQDGIIQVQIVEVILEDIRLEGLRNLNENYLKARLPQIDQPLNINQLLQNLERLQNDPLIKQITGEVTQENFGKNVLLLNIEENPRFDAGLRCTDGYSRSIGSFGCNGKIIYNSALFLGDRIISDGTLTEGLRRGGIGYLIRFNKSNSQISFEYNTANNKIVQEELEDLGIEADYESFDFKFTHFVISGIRESLTLGFGFQHIDSETFVLGDTSFPFVEGLENGETKITVLNFSQEYVKRTSSSLLAINSQFLVGIDAFGATKSAVGIDGIFWSWQGQAQHFKFLNENTILFNRIGIQLTPDQLLPLQQATLGGISTVKGYPSNLTLGDNIIFGNTELRFIVVKDEKLGSITVIPFLNWGTVWNNKRETTGSNTFVSVGLGLRYIFRDSIEFRINYAVPLVDATGYGATDTEENFSFYVVLRPL